MDRTEAQMNYWYRVSAQGHPVPGSLIARKHMPIGQGIWLQVPSTLCCTTTTTTTSSTTTTTTTA